MPGLSSRKSDTSSASLGEDRASAYNRSLLEASLDPLVTIGPDGKIADVNAATEAVTGCTRAALIGTDFSDYFTEPEKARAGYLQVFREGLVRDYPLELRHRDGRITSVLYNASVYRDESGKVIGVFAAARDVTARRRAEAELETYRQHLEDLIKERTSQLETANAQLQAEISERKRIDEALRESSENYRSLFENMLEGLAYCKMIFDDSRRPIDFVYLNVNRAFGALTGLQEVAGKKVSEVIPGLDKAHPELLEIYGRVASTGQPEKFEIELKPLGIWFSIAAYSTENGYFTAVFDNVTERKQAEEALRESEAQFRTLANAIPQLCWMANADGWIFWYNQRWYDYTGTTPEQMEGWGWQSVHDPEALPRVLTQWKVSLATGEPFDMVFPLRGGDGVFRPFLTRVMPVKDAQGRVARWFGTNTDISGQKRAEEALRQSGERFAAVVGSAMDAIITVDPEQRIAMFNAAAEKIFGCPAAEAIGQPLERFIPERFREIHRRHIGHFGKTGVTSRSMQSPGTLYGLRSNGQEFPLEATISQVTVAGQTLYTVILRDITQRKQTETALLTSEKLATVGRLAATVAHEINNPLAAVTNLLYLMQQNPTLDDSGRTYLATAQAEVDRAAHIAKQTLGFSKGGGAISRFRPTEVLDNVLLLCKPKLQNRQIECQREFQTDMAVSGAESEIRQVFWNLLSNAIDAVSQGGRIKVRVSESLRDVGRRGVRVTIGDNGHGISADHLPRLFEPFFTTRHTGNGLGLWITSQLANKHGGSIRVRSRAGRGERTGTVFSVFFPAEPPRAAERPAVPAGEDRNEDVIKRPYLHYSR